MYRADPLDMHDIAMMHTRLGMFALLFVAQSEKGLSILDNPS